MDIKELVVLAKSGDVTAQSQLYEETNKKAYYLALRLLQNPDDAMDVLQDSYIAAFRALDTLQNPEAFSAWLAQIVSNRSKNLLRTRNRYTDVHSDEEEKDYFSNIEDMDEAILPHEVLDKAEIRKLVLQMVDALPYEQRECIMLYYFSGLTTEQIAEMQACSQGTIKSRLNYARKKLKENVLDLEKRTDIRLHTLLPIGALFTGFAAELSDVQAFAAVWQGISAELAAAQGTAAGAAGSTAANTVKTGAAVAAKGKIAALIAAVVMVGAVGVSVLNSNSSEEVSDQAEADSSISVIDQNEVVSFSSAAFEAAFAEAAGLTAGKITRGDLAEVWSIEINQGMMLVNDMFAGMYWDELYDYDAGKLSIEPQNRLTDVDMIDLPLFTELQTVTLRETTAFNTTSLAELNLRRFWLMDSSIEDWSHINGMENLKSLNLYSSSASGGTVDFSLLPELREVRLTTNDASEWGAFQNLSALKNVVIFSGQCSTGAADLGFLSAMSELESCHINMMGTVSLHDFANNTKLRNLEINAIRVPGEEPSMVSWIECVRIFYAQEPSEFLGTESKVYEMVNGAEVDRDVYTQHWNTLNNEINQKLYS